MGWALLVSRDPPEANDIFALFCATIMYVLV